MTDKMTADIERNLGEQPIARILTENHLTRHDLVTASSEHLTHKMVARACKGRRLTLNAQGKILEALNKAANRTYSMEELFNYTSVPLGERRANQVPGD